MGVTERTIGRATGGPVAEAGEPAGPPVARRPAAATHFDPAATAAAGALALVVWTQALHTLGSERWRVWVDALANEWLIWFTILYLAQIGGLALRARVAGSREKARLPAARPGRPELGAKGGMARWTLHPSFFTGARRRLAPACVRDEEGSGHDPSSSST